MNLGWFIGKAKEMEKDFDVKDAMTDFHKEAMKYSEIASKIQLSAAQLSEANKLIMTAKQKKKKDNSSGIKIQILDNNGQWQSIDVSGHHRDAILDTAISFLVERVKAHKQSMDELMRETTREFHE